MALIQWSDSLSVQVAEMDRQHQKLIGLINDLNDAMSKGKGKEIVGKTIDGLLNYTRTHFTEEEKLFGQFNYPDADSQKKMHKKFIDKVVEFKQQLDSGKIGLSIAIIDFLSDWLKNHIQMEDKKYGPFLNQQGVK
jgi:hemerythrin